MNLIFLSCLLAIQSWALNHLSTKVHLDTAQQVTIWLHNLLHLLSRKDMELVAIMLWNLWNNRNGVTFEGSYNDPLSLVSFSINYVHQSREAISNPTHGSITSMQHQATQTQWEKPQMDFVKANFDGVIFPLEGFSGIGVAVRDGVGDFVLRLSKKIPGILASDVIETYAAKFATKLLVELGYSHVALEGDNLKITKMLQQYDSDDSACGVLIDDVLQLLQNFTRWKAIWIPRSLNGAAHSFARNACIVMDDYLWKHSPPSFAVSALQADLIPF